jgi:hypothetical protein
MLLVKLGRSVTRRLTIDVVHPGDGGEVFGEVRIHDQALLGFGENRNLA